MRELIVWVFIFSSASGQFVMVPREVNGRLGGSLSVQCQYKKDFQDYSKYWCRGADRSCSIVVQTSQLEREVRKDLVSIRDDPLAHTFTVTMEGLREEDGGSYQCGIEITGFDYLSPVTVTLLPADSGEVVTGPLEVNGTLGGSLSVECRYEEGYQSYYKYWCRGEDRGCTIVVQTALSGQAVRKDRVSIRDDPSARTFTVTMEGLREEDAGSYQCRMQKAGFDYFSPVKVTLLPADSGTLKPTTASAYTGELESTTHKPIEHLDEILLYIIPAVTVLLLLFLLAAVLLFRAKRRKHQATSQNNDNLQSPDTSLKSNTNYAVLKKTDGSRKPGACNTVPVTNVAMSAVCYADLNDPTLNSTGTADIAYADIQFRAPDQQEEVYANMALPHKKSSLECNYSTVTS